MKRTPLKRKTPLKAKSNWNYTGPHFGSSLTKSPLKKSYISKKKANVMPASLKEDISNDPEYTRCALKGLLIGSLGPCEGRVTREHAMYYKGLKIQEKWAIPPICACHHGVDQYQDGPGEAPKEVRQWVALNRATDQDLKKISKCVDYIRLREFLNKKYGVYVPPPILKKTGLINE